MTPAPAAPALRPATAAALAALVALLVAWGSLARLGPVEPTDFDVVRLAGQLVGEGRIADAYDPAAFAARQAELGGQRWFMPWTYPPPYALVALALAALPAALAFALLVGGGLAAYLAVLWRAGGREAGFALAAGLPAAYICARSGQNGFLSAALLGGAALLLRRGHGAAGVPLGLMALKPHLALGFGLWLLLRRRWRDAAVAVGTAAALSLAALALLGPEPWAAFREALADSGRTLEAGHYPLYRMVSAYAALRSLGVAAPAAMALHAALAVAALALAARRASADPDAALGGALVASLLVSPYLYDYDLPVAAVALALARPGLRAPALAAGLLALAGGWGLAGTALVDLAGPGADGAELAPPALGGLAFAAFALVLLGPRRRAP